MLSEKIMTENEWEICAPEDLGMDGERLWEASIEISRNYPNLHNFIVVRDGCIVFEQYYRDAVMGQKHNIMSADKSILSALTGIAFNEALLQSLDEQLVSFWSEYYNAECDPRILKVTLYQMLTMTSGLYYQRLAEDSQPIVKRMEQYYDWIDYIMHLPFFENPIFKYNNLDPWLMGSILQKVSGKDIYTYANEKLFLPLRMDIENWPALDPMNRVYGALKMNARDMAKIGILYLNNGIWNKKELIPKWWITQSTSDQTGTGYGFYWWRNGNGYYASGAGGTLLMVIPRQRLVVVMQSRHLKRFKFPMPIITDYVLTSTKT